MQGLVLRGVGKRYRRADGWVLRDVDLHLMPGQLARVHGANGSGKSTLLRVIAGTTRPDRGRVQGRPATAYVPERFPAHLPFTPSAYLAHLGRIQGLTTTRAADRAHELLDRFGALGHAHTRMADLSKGTSQKVAVVQALLASPGLLVLDEAWAGLDEPSRAVLDAAVRERVAEGGTAVFVDHDRQCLADAVDITLTVRGGQVVAERSGEQPLRARLVRIDVDLDTPPQGPPGPPLVVALRAMRGVRDVRPLPAAERPGAYRVDADAQACADILRALLADPATRIRAVVEEESDA